MIYKINDNVRIGDSIRIEKPIKLTKEDFTQKAMEKILDLVIKGNAPEIDFIDYIVISDNKDENGIVGVTPSGKRFNLQAIATKD